MYNKNNHPWQENFSIYSDNLSVYFIATILVSFISVVFTWWFNRTIGMRFNTANSTDETFADTSCTSDEAKQQSTGDTYRENYTSGEPIGQITPNKPSLILQQQITAGLTEEELKEEKEAEAQQLAAIYQLLRKQEDIFQVSSMEELEDQMKLYRM